MCCLLRVLTAQALKADLDKYLPQAGGAYIKPQARQVVLKGNFVHETKAWLSSRGF